MGHNHGSNNNDNGAVRIHSQELLKALTKLNDLLGRAAVEHLIDLLKQYHHRVVDETITDNSDYYYYSLDEVQQAFTKMLGPEACQLIIQRLKRELLPG
jgi:flagellar biosynthesis component FlhA